MEQVALGALGDHLRSFLLRVRARTEVPGLAVAVCADGKRVVASVGERCVGTGEPMPSDGAFDLGCIGSLLVAMVTLGLARRQTLCLDAKVGDFLTELAGTPHGEQVRLRHLLSHTAGYGALHERPLQDGPRQWQSAVESLRAEDMLFPPGRVFSYEPVDSLLLDTILRRVTGKTPTELVREMIFEPLGIPARQPNRSEERGRHAGRHGMDRSLRKLVPIEAPPSTGLWSSSFLDVSVAVEDLVLIGEALFGAHGREGRGPEAISSVVAEAIQRPAVRLPAVVGGIAADLMPVAFGLGAALLPGGFWGHNGVSCGQCVGVGIDRRRRICVAVGVNAAVPHVRNLVLAGLLHALSGASMQRAALPFGFEFAEVAGAYRSGGSRAVVVSQESEELWCRIGNHGRAPAVCARLSMGADGVASLLDAPPHLALGFFRGPGAGEIGLLVGMSAFKQAAPAD